jgi:hypothetical protein
MWHVNIGARNASSTASAVIRRPLTFHSATTMLRSTLRLATLILLGSTLGINASVLDCSTPVKLGDRSYDLSSLAGEHSKNITRSTPPSTVDDVLRFDLCTDLKRDKDADDQDQVRSGGFFLRRAWQTEVDGGQCPEGTRVCLTMTNHKPKHKDIVLQVVSLVKSTSDPVAISAVDRTPLSLSAAATCTNFKYLDEPDGLVLFFSGPSYPAEGSQSTVQYLNVTLHCAASAGEPTFSEYTGSTAMINWSLPAGCAKTEDGSEGPDKTPPKDDEDKGGDKDKKKQKVGSGMGWFFLVCVMPQSCYPIFCRLSLSSA